MSFVAVLLLTLSQLIRVSEAEDPLFFRIAEEQPARSEVGNVLRAANLAEQYPADVLPKLRFRFRGPDPLFEITETTGMIRTRRVIDREQIADCMYSASCIIEQEVMITPYAYFRIIRVRIQIDDVNDHAPEFPQPRISLDISESVSRNTTFSIPNADDPDSGVFGVSRYEMITSTDVFGIRVTALPDGSKDLSIVVLKQLDRERENFYSIEIRATDGAVPPRSGTLIVDISVVDFNDNNPVFDRALYEIQIYENLDINTPVVQVHAKDRDEGLNGVVVYEFEAHTLANSGSYFGLHNGSGLIYVKGAIDYETHKSFHLTVMARDLGQNSLPDYAKVNIDVLDLNDNAPVISVNTFTESQYARVPENVPPGHTVAYVGVSDPDSGRGGNVSCDIDNASFRIQLRLNSGTTGYEIVSAREFDREEEERHLVVIRCQDRGSPPQTSSVRIEIRVTDVNDNAPYFRPNSTLFAVSVKENNRIGDVIIKMNTTDRDVMRNSAIRYRLTPLGDTPEGAVAIDLITGVITAKVEFDYETRTDYQYMIVASDQGEPPRSATTTLDLQIVDQNDGFPHFLKTSYTFSVPENQVANTEVGTVRAVDSDSPPYDRIVYSLLSTADSYKFYVDPESGTLTTSTILDREEAAVYRLVAVASNEGSPRVKSTVNVTVYVLDENDNPPVMVFPTEANDTIQVPTVMSVGHHVVQIEAVDPDADANAELRFAISSGNEDGNFGIDPETGAIWAARAIRRRHLSKQVLILKVSDLGPPERRTFARLTVVFNQSVPLSGSSGAALLGQDTLVILIVAAIGGCVFIVTVISLAICCVRRSRRDKDKRQHVYNCRAEEAKKALSGPDSRASSTSDGFPDSDKSVDTGIGSKTKDKTKKEVTFSVDMDDGWPLNTDKAVIENAHVQHVNPSQCRLPPYTAERGRIPALTEDVPDDCATRIRPVVRQGSCCLCQKHAEHRPPPPPLTQHNLQVLEYNNMYWPNNVDRDSESGCSGTDSGRGNSEEGECPHHGELNISHDHCGHAPCCCSSSAIYAKRFHGHLHPGTVHACTGSQCHGAQRDCTYCAATSSSGHHHHHHSHQQQQQQQQQQQEQHQQQEEHGLACGATCEHNVVGKSSPSHDECTPLEALPSFGRPPYKDRAPFGRTTAARCPDCAGGRGPRQRLSLDPDDVSRCRQYGFAPSMPSLSDRRSPSPTFTSASDSQYYPYTGAHRHQEALCPRAGSKTSTFTPLVGNRSSPTRDDDDPQSSLAAMSDDGTTTSGSYSMVEHGSQSKVVAMDAPVADCYV